MKAYTYIFVHNEKIIFSYEKNRYLSKHFGEDYSYVFLGNAECTSVCRTFDNIIVARDLPNNIEQYSKAVAYTGWYALWANNLITADYINLFEYDISINDNLVDFCDDVSVKYYKELPSNILYDCVLSKSITLSPDDLLHSKLPVNWMVTTNLTWKATIFKQFMEWFHVEHFLPNADNFEIGHIFERYPTYFCHKIGIDMKLYNKIEHFQLDSHDTQGIYYRYESYLSELA